MDLIINEYNDTHLVVTYEVKSKTTLRDAAWQIAIGQSIGNPNVRNSFETDELIEKYSAKILDTGNLDSSEGTIIIVFPEHNFNFKSDGVSHLLCTVMGGQMDIDTIQSCRVVDIIYPKSFVFRYPQFGIKGIRELTERYDKPLLGAILKPKIGISPDQILELIKGLIDEGVDFIKEDEILSNQSFSPLYHRANILLPYLSQQRVIYCFSVQSDDLLENASYLESMDANGIHINFWNGFGSYKRVREDTNLFIHFQKSGDKILTTGKYSIDENVIFDLVSKLGCDSAHCGMIGGYYPKEEQEKTLKNISTLNENGCLPALSCGMHPGLISSIKEKIGHNDWMANVGAAIWGHPDGYISGVRAMRQAIDGNYGEEYYVAVDRWGS